MDLIEALEAKGIDYHESQSRDNEVWICCPFCDEQGTTPDTRYRLSVNLETGWMHCFNCGKGSRSEEYTWNEIQRALDTGTLQAVAKDGYKRKKKASEKIELPVDFKLVKVSGNKERWDELVYQYLKGRRLTDEQIVRRQIGYSMVGMFRYRIVIPVFYQGKLKGLVGRAFVSGLEPPYLNSIGDKALYRASIGKKQPHIAVVLEGVFDSLRVAGAVAHLDGITSYGALGTSLTELQWSQLEKYTTLISWFDPDDAGIKGTIKFAKECKRRGERHLFVPTTVGEPDPDEFSYAEIRRRLRTARRWTDGQGLKLRLSSVPIE